ncbi:hypothetical protein [Cecembia lonarensis]|uniref:Uncharacterized protein n=1 Tax=Cecembia lonarensis (strain CCUG 58316 / KCTC 22772 / LW9) TaxID=1225176 RepID=K1KXW8_CECL9|nr:hypothetical protein [Cecembia lonarensis]EKB48980.1 hypothetical protein B879_02396 [Cecembia lonarensis LW9]
MKRLLIYLKSLIIISCGGENTITNEVLNSYELIKVDAFEIENFTMVHLVDFSNEEGIFLGFSEVQNEVLEISPEGEILKRVNRTGDGPNNYGTWNPIGLSFGPDGKRVFQFPFRLITYSTDYEIVDDFRVPSPLPIRTYRPIGKTAYFKENGNTRYLVGPSAFLSAHHLIFTEEGRDTLQNFTLLKTESGETKTVLPYEEDSYYKKTDQIYYNLMAKSYFIEGNELFLVHNLDDAIHVYDLKDDFKLLRKIPIYHSQFEKASPLPIGIAPDDPRVKNLANLPGRNRQLLNLGDNTWILTYYKGVSQAVFEARNSEEKPFSILDQEDKLSLVVFENGKQLEGELALPDGTILFALPDKKILIKEKSNEEVEEEVTRYSIYQLVKN